MTRGRGGSGAEVSVNPLKSCKAAFIKLKSSSKEMAVPFTRKSTVRTFR